MNTEAQEKICEIIFYFIHAVPRLKYLFLRWCCLTNEDKYNIDEEVLNKLHVKGQFLYAPLREAFIQWDKLQDTQGAPGFQSGCHEFKCDTEIEEEITRVVNAFEVTLDNLYIKKNLNSEEERIFEWTKLNMLSTDPGRFRMKRSKSLSDLYKPGSCNNKHFTYSKRKYLTKTRSEVSNILYDYVFSHD